MVSSSSSPINFEVAIHKIVREEWGYLLSSLIKSLRDIHLAEDVLQDAVEAAIVKWQKNGVPNFPKAWLLTVAKRKAIDRIRRDNNFQQKKEEYIALLEEDDAPREDEFTVPDERLRLIFTCCHPALNHSTSVALTLQLLGGLTTAEISRAFLTTKETMGQRLVRGKRKIKQTAIPYTVPEKEIFAERLDAVLSVLYLIFNEGYSATSGDHHIRAELCQEAIRLLRILNSLCPEEAEVEALLALTLLHDSRRKARFNVSGDFVSLENQNRKIWDKEKIKEGLLLVESALKKRKIGSYQIQAAISAAHTEASSYKETNWSEIVLLYDELYKLTPTPVVKLNKLVALSYLEPIAAVLKALSTLEDELISYQPFYATKADFLTKAGDFEQAKRCYLEAIKLSGNEKEREFLHGRLLSINSLQN